MHCAIDPSALQRANRARRQAATPANNITSQINANQRRPSSPHLYLTLSNSRSRHWCSRRCSRRLVWTFLLLDLITTEADRKQWEESISSETSIFPPHLKLAAGTWPGVYGLCRGGGVEEAWIIVAQNSLRLGGPVSMIQRAWIIVIGYKKLNISFASRERKPRTWSGFPAPKSSLIFADVKLECRSTILQDY